MASVQHGVTLSQTEHGVKDTQVGEALLLLQGDRGQNRLWEGTEGGHLLILTPSRPATHVVLCAFFHSVDVYWRFSSMCQDTVSIGSLKSK